MTEYWIRGMTSKDIIFFFFFSKHTYLKTYWDQAPGGLTGHGRTTGHAAGRAACPRFPSQTLALRGGTRGPVGPGPPPADLPLSWRQRTWTHIHSTGDPWCYRRRGRRPARRSDPAMPSSAVPPQLLQLPQTRGTAASRDYQCGEAAAPPSRPPRSLTGAVVLWAAPPASSRRVALQGKLHCPGFRTAPRAAGSRLSLLGTLTHPALPHDALWYL